jgi:uncharacterized membrane protein
MNLPKIDIPLTLPFDVPLLAHPPLVHFAIALPVIILVLELVNIFMKKRAISGVTFSMLAVLVVVLFGAFFTGKADGSEAFVNMSSDAKEILKEHKLLGTYLFYASLVLFLFKLLNLTKRGFVKAIYILTLIGFVAAILHQGKEGGELVFKHGTSIEIVTELKDEMFDLKEELEELAEEDENSEETQNHK